MNSASNALRAKASGFDSVEDFLLALDTLNVFERTSQHTEMDVARSSRKDSERSKFGDSFEELLGSSDTSSASWLKEAVGDLFESVKSLLMSSNKKENIEGPLVDLLGIESLDLVEKVISNFESLRLCFSSTSKGSTNSQQNNELFYDQYGKFGSSVKISGAASIKAAVSSSTTSSSKAGRKYPHIYAPPKKSDLELIIGGGKIVLPKDTIRSNNEFYEGFALPFDQNDTVEKYGIVRRSIEESFPWYFWAVFSDYLMNSTDSVPKGLNEMQSAVYPVAFLGQENMLVSAPTGAGKTDIAMMVTLRTIQDNLVDMSSVVGDFIESTLPHRNSSGATIEKKKIIIKTDDFKVIYVAPMKALAAEVTAKFNRRLCKDGGLPLHAREYTGDMQLTATEIRSSQVIVTTPEKFDVITRNSLTRGKKNWINKIKLLIIDEVHLLHEERGSVLESLLARLFRWMELTGNYIRIVGLSATLPNYEDVALFLKVNLYKGLFYFEGAFRPVPLKQQFIGIKKRALVKAEDNKDAKTRLKADKDFRNVSADTASNNLNATKDSKGTCDPTKGKFRVLREHEILNIVTLEKTSFYLSDNYQVMIFVHSRKETFKTAKYLLDNLSASLLLVSDGKEEEVDEPRKRKSIVSSELRSILGRNIGIHHAGLVRADRSLVESLFLSGKLRVLVSTATLAWGINLPAHAVIIKGTSVFDASSSSFKDLGVLDVLQIFGRAGRPPFDTFGEAILMTSHEKLTGYLRKMTLQMSIESSFLALKDSSIPSHPKISALLATLSHGSTDRGILFCRLLRSEQLRALLGSKLLDHLNAEITLGLITDLDQAKSWLYYTFFYIRLVKNTIDVQDVENYLSGLLNQAILALEALQFITIRKTACTNQVSSPAYNIKLHSEQLGRIACKFYLLHETVFLWNTLMCSHLYSPSDFDDDSGEMYFLQDSHTTETIIMMLAEAIEFQDTIRITLVDDEQDFLLKLIGRSGTEGSDDGHPRRSMKSANAKDQRASHKHDPTSSSTLLKLYVNPQSMIPYPPIDVDSSTLKIYVIIQFVIFNKLAMTQQLKNHIYSSTFLTECHVLSENLPRVLSAFETLASSVWKNENVQSIASYLRSCLENDASSVSKSS